jgi:hypothetical protein
VIIPIISKKIETVVFVYRSAGVRRTGNGQKVGIVAKGFNFNWVFLALRMLVSFAAPVNYLATNCLK